MGFAVGDRCKVEGYAPEGTIKFVGNHHEKGKPRLGVEFDEAVEKGKSGTFFSHEYFAGKKKCCLLVLPKNVTAVVAEVVAFDADAAKADEVEALKFSEEDVGKRCKAKGYESEGTIRFVGRHHKTAAPKCGVEFDEAVEKGKAGKFGGNQYFECTDGHGLLLNMGKISILGEKKKKKKASAKKEAAEGAPAEAATPEGPIDYDSKKRMALIKILKGRSVEYKDIKDDVEALRALAKSTDPAAAVAEAAVDEPEPTPDPEPTPAPEPEPEAAPAEPEPVVEEPEPKPAAEPDLEVYDNAEATEVASPEEEGGEMYGASDPTPVVEATEVAPPEEEGGEMYGASDPTPAAAEVAGDGGDDHYGPAGDTQPAAIDAQPAAIDDGMSASERGFAQRQKEGEAAKLKSDQLNAEVKARKDAEAAAAEARRAKKDADVKAAEEAEVERVRMLSMNTKQRIQGAAEARTDMMLAELLAGTPTSAGAEVLKPAHLWTGTLRDRNFTSSRPHKDRKFTAQNARFNSKTGWVANTAVDDIFLQIDLDGIVLISHLLMRGVKGADNFTKEFSLSFSANGVNFIPFTKDGSEEEDADPLVFKANKGTDDLAIVDLPRPLATRFIRICPVAAGAEPGMRVDIFARPVGDPIGLANGTFPDSLITTSSQKVATLSGAACRLPTPRTVKSKGMPTAWQALDTDTAPWITFKFAKGEMHLLTAIAVQGRQTLRGQWVKEFEIGINDGIDTAKEWQMYGDDFGTPITFAANSNMGGVTVITFDKPMIASSVRIFPKNWTNACAMRAELFTVKVGGFSGIADGTVPDSALCASNSYSKTTGAEHGRLHGGGVEGGWACSAGHGTAHSWKAAVVDSSGHKGEGNAAHDVNTKVDEVQAIENTAFLQVDLGEIRRINAVVVQGRGTKFTQYVKTFRVTVSIDGIYFLPCTADDGSDIFMGNEDATSPMVRQLAPVVAGRFVRFTPISWHQRAAMRVEVISKSFGADLGAAVEGSIAGDKFQSTTLEPTETSLATNARLDNDVPWKPETQDENQFVEIDLETPHQINAVVVQGAPAVQLKDGTQQDAEEWVSSYRLELSKNGADWWAHSEGGYVKVFPGVTVANATVASPVIADCVAQYIRICPMTWNAAIAMRFDIMGNEVAGIGGQAKTLLTMVDDEAEFGNAADAGSDDEDFSNPWGIKLASTGDMANIKDNGNLMFVQERTKRRMSGVYGFDDDDESLIGFGGA